jgi:hypothetical protein
MQPDEAPVGESLPQDDRVGAAAAVGGKEALVIDLTMSALGCDFITVTSAGG